MYMGGVGKWGWDMWGLWVVWVGVGYVWGMGWVGGDRFRVRVYVG